VLLDALMAESGPYTQGLRSIRSWSPIWMFGVMEWWSDGVLECWSIGVLWPALASERAEGWVLECLILMAGEVQMLQIHLTNYP
jgi:hypothetical protein